VDDGAIDGEVGPVERRQPCRVGGVSEQQRSVPSGIRPSGGQSVSARISPICAMSFWSPCPARSVAGRDRGGIRATRAGVNSYASFVRAVTFDHYLAGVVGLGLIRHWHDDGKANDDRLDELADAISKRDEFPFSLELTPSERSVEDGYDEWAASYDGPNPMIELEEAVVTPMLERRAAPGVRALDAACGTGRHAERLDAWGCVTTGVDLSEPMLAVARAKVPGATFVQGDIERTTFDDDAFELAVIALALCHLADPMPAVVELGRVIAPGGTLVIADPHPMGGVFGGQAFYGGIANGRRMTYVRNHRHGASTWLQAFGAAGLVVAECIEVPMTEQQILGDPVASFHPDAARAAFADLPSIWVWELRKPD